MAQDLSVQDEVLDKLVEDGLVTSDQVRRGRQLAQTDPAHPVVVWHLVRIGAITPERLTIALGQHFKVQGVDLTAAQPPSAVLGELPPDVIEDNHVVPIHRDGEELFVALADPTDIEVQENLKFATDCRHITPLVADVYSLEKFIDRHFGGQGAEIGKLIDEMGAEAEEIEVMQDEEEDITAIALEEEVEAAPVVKFVNGILMEAVQKEASDIHFEFYERTARVRFRIDGALVEVAKIPQNLHRPITTRLKIMSDLDISERRVPQDGRTKLKVGGRKIDFRVSSLPTSFGEKIVLRILDKSIVSLDLETLGIRGREKDLILQAIQSPFGMCLVTGPTGSGKTTSLYSILSRLNQPDVNILTVEDPIEFDLVGINQTAVKRTVGLDFATALRSFLRQDPDIVMVGEIRDEETASIGVRAALTGHLVLSTLHTNDSASTITRLTEMGVERFNISSAVKIIVAQRLVREICTHCKAEATYPEEQLRYAHISPSDAERIPFRRGTGCQHCNGTGYDGRLGLFEVLPVTTEISEMILAGATASDIKQRAVRDGMKTLRMAGMEKVKQGRTTLEEVLKQTTIEF